MSGTGSAGLPPSHFLISALFRGIILVVLHHSGEVQLHLDRADRDSFDLPNSPSQPRSPLSIEAGRDQIEVLYCMRRQLPRAKLETADRRTQICSLGLRSTNRKPWYLEVGDARLLMMMMMMRPCPCWVSLHTTAEGSKFGPNVEHEVTRRAPWPVARICQKKRKQQRTAG